MKRLFALITLALALTFTGCSSLIPKRVELFQDKVEKLPVAKSSERETQRQAAQRAAQKSEQTLQAAIDTEALPVVVAPAAEAAVLTKSVSQSLGPPLSPATQPSDELAKKLDTAVAKLNARIEEFREDNDKNAGHKIEDTGFLKIPYLVWLGGALVLGFIALIIVGVLWTFLKMYALSNPPVALGVGAVQAGGALASKGFGQLMAGGEKFKGWVKTDLPEVSDATKEKILELFTSAHKEESDKPVRDIVDALTKK